MPPSEASVAAQASGLRLAGRSPAPRLPGRRLAGRSPAPRLSGLRSAGPRPAPRLSGRRLAGRRPGLLDDLGNLHDAAFLGVLLDLCLMIDFERNELLQ